MGGITGITQNKEALDRYFVIAPQLAKIVDDFQNHFGEEKQSRTLDHYQLHGSMSSRLQKNALKLKDAIVQHLEGNPFEIDVKLMNLFTHGLIESHVDDILKRDDKGQVRFEEFKEQRLIKETATMTLWDKIKKMNLKTFNTSTKKNTIKIDSKIIKLREDRQLLARFLVLQKSRPNIVDSLEEMIGQYEFGVIPRSLFSADGVLLIPSDKSSFMKVIEEYNVPSDVAQSRQIRPGANRNICIIDGMAIVQSMKKDNGMNTCLDFARAFVQSIKRLASGYQELRVIFDRYIETSLKANTRAKRTKGVDCVKYNISDKTNIKTVPLKTFLSHIETKSQLTEYLGQHLLSAFSESEVTVVVVFKTETFSNKSNAFDESIRIHSHEEADTLIPLHVLDAVKQTPEDQAPAIHVYSPDTDVFILLIDLYARHHISAKINFVTGKGAKERRINIEERYFAIGPQKSLGLLALHHFSGADWSGKLFGVSKKKWLNIYLQDECSHDIVHCLEMFGNTAADTSFEVKCLEQLVCLVYGQQGLSTVGTARWALFSKKGYEAENHLQLKER